MVKGKVKHTHTYTHTHTHTYIHTHTPAEQAWVLLAEQVPEEDHLNVWKASVD